jgi:hypothetical protein
MVCLLPLFFDLSKVRSGKTLLKLVVLIDLKISFYFLFNIFCIQNDNGF